MNIVANHFEYCEVVVFTQTGKDQEYHTKYWANTLGCSTINGNSVISFYENSKKQYLCPFLETLMTYT